MITTSSGKCQFISPESEIFSLIHKGANGVTVTGERMNRFVKKFELTTKEAILFCIRYFRSINKIQHYKSLSYGILIPSIKVKSSVPCSVIHGSLHCLYSTGCPLSHWQFAIEFVRTEITALFYAIRCFHHLLGRGNFYDKDEG